MTRSCFLFSHFSQEEQCQDQKERGIKEREECEQWYIGLSRKLERNDRLSSWVRSNWHLASA